MVTAIAVDPIPQGLFVHPDFPGGRRNRLGFLDHHPSDLFLVFRSERPALVRHGHPLFRERNLSGFPVRKIPGPSLPPSLAMLVEVFGSCFMVSTFATFRVL